LKIRFPFAPPPSHRPKTQDLLRTLELYAGRNIVAGRSHEQGHFFLPRTALGPSPPTPSSCPPHQLPAPRRPLLLYICRCHPNLHCNPRLPRRDSLLIRRRPTRHLVPPCLFQRVRTEKEPPSSQPLPMSPPPKSLAVILGSSAGDPIADERVTFCRHLLLPSLSNGYQVDLFLCANDHMDTFWVGQLPPEPHV
jgi:hypothetical protein